jgi:hypothetical protein
MPSQQNFLRRGIHHILYALCALAIGITPPTEKQEVPFFLILVGAILFIGLAMYFVATVVPTIFR